MKSEEINANDVDELNNEAESVQDEQEAEAPELMEPETKEQQESQEMRLMRLQADFDNFRKRVQKERVDMYRRANQDLIEELLPVLDHYEMGLKNAKEQQASPAILDGFMLVYDQLLGALKKFGLEVIDATGCEFDPHLHEALMHTPSDSVPADHVIEQFRPGYKLGDQLIRPVQVIVSSGMSDEPNA